LPAVLKKLHLQFNKIESLVGLTIPNTGQFFVNFPLTHLHLQNNALTSIPITLFTKMPNLEELHLGYNKIASLADVSMPDKLKKLDLGNNQIASLQGVSIPNTVTHLDLRVNPMIALNVVIDTVGAAAPTDKSALATQNSVLDLPAALKCIPDRALRIWVSLTKNSANSSNVYPGCRWLVTKCNTVVGDTPPLKVPKRGNNILDLDNNGNPVEVDSNGNLIMPDNTDDCCVWYGSYLGGPLNRTGVCPDTKYDTTGIVLSDRGITAISPGAFVNCGSPQSLTLAKNRISSLSIPGSGVVTFPVSLTHLDLSDNMLKSLSGVTLLWRIACSRFLLSRQKVLSSWLWPCRTRRRASTKTSSSSSGQPWRPLPARPLKTLRSRPSPKAGDGVRGSTLQTRSTPRTPRAPNSYPRRWGQAVAPSQK